MADRKNLFHLICPSNCGKLTQVTTVTVKYDYVHRIISFVDVPKVHMFIETGSQVDWAVTAVHLYAAVSCSPVLISDSYEATGDFPK